MIVTRVIYDMIQRNFLDRTQVYAELAIRLLLFLKDLTQCLWINALKSPDIEMVQNWFEMVHLLNNI